VFINLENAYDKVPRKVLWECLAKKEVSETYIRAIKHLYEGVKTSARSLGGDIEDFPTDNGLHQGSTLSPFLFTIIMDVLMKGMQDEVSWCMLFAADIVLINETRDGLNSKLEHGDIP